MRRRDIAVWIAALPLFVVIVGSPTPGCAQATLPIVAVLRATGPEAAHVDVMFREALRSIGHEDGRTIKLVHYAADNDPTRLPGLSATIVASRPSVVVVMGPATARAVKAASTSIPIVAFTSFPVIELAARHRLPAIYAFRNMAFEGGLMSYGVDVADLYRRSAEYVDRILRGADPGDLPIQAPTGFELVINLGTARALGLQVPRELLLRADEVIE